MSSRPFYILPIIIFAQFAGTSLWFAGNAVLPDLQKTFDLAPESLGAITSSVQFGFIIGTLLFAFFLLPIVFLLPKYFSYVLYWAHSLMCPSIFLPKALRPF
jgi:hypothetical protein